VGLSFGNPIVGGVTLVRPAIRSPNYAAGLTGWTVNQDGSAEFNNVAIRGGLIEGAPGLYYSGTPAANNLVASVSATAFTDQFGNFVLAGEATYHFTSVGPSGSLAISVNDGAVTWWAATTGTLGPWTQTTQLQALNVVPGLFITAAIMKLAAGDGNSYNIGHLSAPTTALLPLTINQTTAQTITGCSVQVASGRLYRFRVSLQFQGNIAAGNPSFQLGSPAIQAAWGNAEIWDTSTGANRKVANTSGLLWQGPVLSTNVWEVTVDASAVFTASGAVTLQAFTSNAADTYKILNAVLDLAA
jgi:hypothetical protein